MKINYNNIEYTLHIIQLAENLSIKITNTKNNLECIVTYIPCGDVHFDYNIVINKGMDETTIENILEQFTEMVVRSWN